MSDFFDDVASGPQRGRGGRPLIIPRGVEVKDENRVEYTRASALADEVADLSYLHTWRMRYLARGIAQNYDLALLASAEQYTTGFGRAADKESMRANSASGRRLDEIINRALDRVRISELADYGTAIHAFTEPGSLQPPAQVAGVPDHSSFNPQADAASFWEKSKDLGIKHLATEVFTACDLLRTAGTFDHLSYFPGYGICVGDKKTSREVHGHDFGIQLGGYANSDVYDYGDDSRMTLEEYVESLGHDPRLVNRKVGFIYWIRGGKTKVQKLDLELGFEAAKHAAWIRDNHRKGSGHVNAERELAAARSNREEMVMAAIQAATTVEALEDVYRRHKLDWDPITHTAAAKARKQEL